MSKLCEQVNSDSSVGTICESQTVSNVTTKRKKLGKNREGIYKKINRQMFVMCIPALTKIVVFNFIPMIWFLIAFQRFIPHKGILGSPFVGWNNFELLFSSDLKRLLTNAIVLNLINMFVPLFFQILFGLLLFEITKKWQLKIIQTIWFFPFFISWPLVGTMLSSLINADTGIITNLIFNATGSRIRFYDIPEYWRAFLTITNTWKGAGVSAVLYYAILLGNDQSAYEAADIDGASRWQKMFYLSLPSLKLMIILGLIQASAGIVRVDFSWVYYCTGNSKQLYSVTETIECYMFNALRTSANFMIGTAVGIVQSTLGLILSLVINKIVKKVSAESSLY